jgi:hypothetical protein
MVTYQFSLSHLSPWQRGLMFVRSHESTGALNS